MNIKTITLLPLIFGLSVSVLSSQLMAHGDVSPQPVATEGLEPLGTEWKEVNPYRGNGLAVEIGESAYTQNCARCHGLGAVSGGIAPDLRELPWGAEGDEYFVQRVRNGAIRNGVTYMPSFEAVVSQEGLWTIRAWLDTLNVEKPDDFKVSEVPADAVKSTTKKDDTAETKAADAKTPVVVANGKARTGEEIVTKTCGTCHVAGLAEAPKIDKTGHDNWAKRYETHGSIDSMVALAKVGKGAMPPMGADPTLSDEELKNAIIHMLGLAGVELKK